jgi:hypothetical protein
MLVIGWKIIRIVARFKRGGAKETTTAAPTGILENACFEAGKIHILGKSHV